MVVLDRCFSWVIVLASHSIGAWHLGRMTRIHRICFWVWMWLKTGGGKCKESNSDSSSVQFIIVIVRNILSCLDNNVTHFWHSLLGGAGFSISWPMWTPMQHFEAFWISKFYEGASLALCLLRWADIHFSSAWETRPPLIALHSTLLWHLGSAFKVQPRVISQDHFESAGVF